MDKKMKQLKTEIMDFTRKFLEGGRRSELMLESLSDMQKKVMEHVVNLAKCEKLFPVMFLTEDMKDDFVLIARDFLRHEGGDLSELRDDTWFLDDINLSMQEHWMASILGAAYRSAKKGSTYSRELLKYLFRTYYPQLYKSFKRFREIGIDDIFALAGDIRDAAPDRANDVLSEYVVLVCIAPLFNITLKEDCKYLLSPFERQYDQFELKLDPESTPISDGEMEKSYNDLSRLLPKDHSEKSRDACLPYISAVLEYYGYDKDIFLCAAGSVNMVESYALLKRTYPDAEHSPKEIYLYTYIFKLAELFGNGLDDFSAVFKAVLGLDDDVYGPDSYLFNPEKIVLPSDGPKMAEPLKEPVFAEPTAPVSKDELSEQVRSLEAKLAKAANENRHLRDRLKHAESRSVGYEKLESELSDCRKELAALRSHLYNLSRYEEPAKDSVDEDRMAEEISRLQVTIIGGHPNWTSKLKNKFPKWNFVTPQVSVGNDRSWVAGSDHVFFFTDTLSHAVYESFIAAVRELRIPFGYIHGVNISANIRQIWEETREQ